MLKKVRVLRYKLNTYWYKHHVGCVYTIDTENREKDGSYLIVDKHMTQGERLNPDDIDMNYDRREKLIILNEKNKEKI